MWAVSFSVLSGRALAFPYSKHGDGACKISEDRRDGGAIELAETVHAEFCSRLMHGRRETCMTLDATD